MTEPIELAVDALAVARLTRLLQHDEVWPVLEAREAFERWAGGTRWADLTSCPWCLSMWLGAGVAGARRLFPRAWPVVGRILAASATTGYLEQAVGQ